MPEPIRFGLIGLGRHGLRYATHLLETNPFAELTAVSRQDVQRGQEFAQSHHLYYFQNPRDLIHHSQVDAVLLVIPPEAVLPLALEAIQARKPLIVEKPLSISSSQARQIVEAARTTPSSFNDGANTEARPTHSTDETIEWRGGRPGNIWF